MAVARVFGSKNTLQRLQITDGTVTNDTAKRFELVEGTATAKFMGEFTYGIFGSPFGTLDTYTYSIGSNVRLKVTKIDADMYQVFTRLDFLSSAWEAEKIIYGSADRMYGNSGRNLFEGHDGNDRIFGNAGADILAGGAGRDLVKGGKGNDQINGDAGADNLQGGSGQDRMIGGTGNDRMSGQAGADDLDGDAGNDTLDGGKGKDELRGDTGKDVFVFRKDYGDDTVMDFRNDHDRIRLDDSLWTGDLNRKQVVKKFAELDNGSVVFDFGTDTLTLKGFTNLNDLFDDLNIV